MFEIAAGVVVVVVVVLVGWFINDQAFASISADV